LENLSTPFKARHEYEVEHTCKSGLDIYTHGKLLLYKRTDMY